MTRIGTGTNKSLTDLIFMIDLVACHSYGLQHVHYNHASVLILIRSEMETDKLVLAATLKYRLMKVQLTPSFPHSLFQRDFWLHWDTLQWLWLQVQGEIPPLHELSWPVEGCKQDQKSLSALSAQALGRIFWVASVPEWKVSVTRIWGALQQGSQEDSSSLLHDTNKACIVLEHL